LFREISLVVGMHGLVAYTTKVKAHAGSVSSL
jgi:hypothetical protein